MTNKIVYLTGSLKWAKLITPDDKYGGSWQVDLYPDTDSLKTFKNLNLELTVREDKETGEPFVKLRRPCQKILKGELVNFDPPKVIDADNKPIGKDVGIGNGSKATVKIVTFPTPKGNGHRLEAVQITDLVEYKKTEVVAPDLDGFVAF